MTNLNGKRAVVTGASRGIGRAIAVRLGELGASVVINYNRDESNAQKTASLLEEAGAPASTTIRADVGRPDECRRLIEEAGDVDILVNNAGIQRLAPILKMEDADWQDVIDVNLSAAFYLSQAVLPSMLAKKEGRIINVASASSYHAHPGIAAYVAAKHGIIGLTKALAVETAKKGILVNAVAPGLTETDMIAGLDDKQRQMTLAVIPMRRVAEPEEIASLVGWVASEATYSTGNVFHAGGGVVMG